MSLSKIIMIDLLNPKTYLWIDAILIKETQKAIMIMFDGAKIWIPKAWVARIERDKHSDIVKIKIFEYHWTKKFY